MFVSWYVSLEEFENIEILISIFKLCSGIVAREYIFATGTIDFRFPADKKTKKKKKKKKKRKNFGANTDNDNNNP